MRNITISIDDETWKIYKKLPDQERSAIIRTLIKTLDPRTGEKKPESNAEQIKKLLTLEPFHEQPHKKGDSGRATQASYVLANTTINQKNAPLEYMIQQNENRPFSSYNCESGSLSA